MKSSSTFQTGWSESSRAAWQATWASMPGCDMIEMDFPSKDPFWKATSSQGMAKALEG